MMDLKNKNDFNSIAQRVLWGYRFVFSEFAPIPLQEAGEQEQRELHTCMGCLIEALYDDPGLLNLPMREDEAYNACYNENPELSKVYKEIFKKIYEFYRFLYVAGVWGVNEESSIRISKAMLKEHKAAYKKPFTNALAKVDIQLAADKEEIVLSCPENPKLLHTLKILATTIENRKPQVTYCAYRNDYYAMFDFVRCSFTGEYVYLLKRMDDLYGYDGMLMRLRKRCLAERFYEKLHLDFAPTCFCFSIKYQIKPGFGFDFAYNAMKLKQFDFGTLSGVGEKAMLEDYENLSNTVLQHFLAICQPCNELGCCTNHGKTKIQTVKVMFKGKEYKLCPRFPKHRWDEMNEELVETLFCYLEEQQKYV